jgi:hypothetical protein
MSNNNNNKTFDLHFKLSFILSITVDCDTLLDTEQVISSPSIYRVGYSISCCDLTTPLFTPVDIVYGRLLSSICDPFLHVISDAGFDDPVVQVIVNGVDPVAMISLLPVICVVDGPTENL